MGPSQVCGPQNRSRIPRSEILATPLVTTQLTTVIGAYEQFIGRKYHMRCRMPDWISVVNLYR